MVVCQRTALSYPKERLVDHTLRKCVARASMEIEEISRICASFLDLLDRRLYVTIREWRFRSKVLCFSGVLPIIAASCHFCFSRSRDAMGKTSMLGCGP